MDLSSDEDEYDFDSSDDDIEMDIQPTRPSVPVSDYELIQRESVYGLMNSVLADLVKITQISYVSTDHLGYF